MACNGSIYGPNAPMENPSYPHKFYEVNFLCFSGSGWEVSMTCSGSSQLCWGSTSVASLTCSPCILICLRRHWLSVGSYPGFCSVFQAQLIQPDTCLCPAWLFVAARAPQPSANLYQTKQYHIPDVVLLIVTPVEASSTSYNSYVYMIG
jgi:hypothetical protein